MSNRIGLSVFVFVLLSGVGLIGQSKPQKPPAPPPPPKTSPPPPPAPPISDERGGSPMPAAPGHRGSHSAMFNSSIVIRFSDELPSSTLVTGNIVSVDLKKKSFVLREKSDKGVSKVTIYHVNDKTKIHSYDPNKPEGKLLKLSDLKPGQIVTIMHFMKRE